MPSTAATWCAGPISTARPRPRGRGVRRLPGRSPRGVHRAAVGRSSGSGRGAGVNADPSYRPSLPGQLPSAMTAFVSTTAAGQRRNWTRCPHRLPVLSRPRGRHRRAQHSGLGGYRQHDIWWCWRRGASRHRPLPWCSLPLVQGAGDGIMEGLFVLLGLTLLAVPVLLIVALAMISGLRHRVDALERELGELQVEAAARSTSPDGTPEKTLGELMRESPPRPIRPPPRTEAPPSPPIPSQSKPRPTPASAPAATPRRRGWSGSRSTADEGRCCMTPTGPCARGRRRPWNI